MPTRIKYLPKKHLGQNFLADPRIQQKIIASSNLRAGDAILEIGPGQGAITRLIAPHVQSVLTIEKDKDLIEGLRSEFIGTNVEIINKDFLAWEMNDLKSQVKVIGNIPYNISTPIIEKLIAHRSLVTQAYLTVQLEFGQRLAANPGSKDYGSLSCFIQFYAGVKLLFPIKSSAFRPAPKVDSCFVRLDFQDPPVFKPCNDILMFKFIRTVFTQRRKNILNSASSMVDKAKMASILKDLSIPSDARPETLSLQNFVDISHRLV